MSCSICRLQCKRCSLRHVISSCLYRAAAAAVAAAGLPGASSKAEEPLYQLMSVAAVVDALPAAHSLAMACMQTFALLLGCHKELPETLQLQVLTALAQQQQRQQQSADQASEEVRPS
jgi:hypothetical protein